MCGAARLHEHKKNEKQQRNQGGKSTVKKTLSLLLTLCLLLSALPTQVFAYVGDIWPASDAVKQTVLNSGSLALQNEYLRVIARWDGTLSTTPAADGTDPTDRQTPFCEFVTYGSNHITHPTSLRLKSLKFVKQTPNGTANAIQAEYDLTVDLGKLTVSGTTSVYYEIVQLKEDPHDGRAGPHGRLLCDLLPDDGKDHYGRR